MKEPHACSVEEYLRAIESILNQGSLDACQKKRDAVVRDIVRAYFRGGCSIQSTKTVLEPILIHVSLCIAQANFRLNRKQSARLQILCRELQFLLMVERRLMNHAEKR